MANIRKDKDILMDIENELVWDTRVLSDNVDVAVVDGEAVLTGSVGSFNAKQAAETDAWSILGVTNVVNNLSIKYPDLEPISDEAIKERIESKFLWDVDLMSFKLEVEVDKGVVTITGNVDALWKKSWAESLVRSTAGVVMVKNSIAIAPEEDYTDETIADDISESLARKLWKSDLDKIDVKVEDGEVVLSGSVVNYPTWDLVFETAMNTPGAIGVKDKLSIESIK